MGREAQCEARVGPDRAAVKALLESTALILRGAIKRRWALDSLDGVAVVAGELQFHADGEPVALALGDVESRRWATKIATPPPTLAAKLGVGPQQPVLVWGRVDDAALAAALQGAVTTDPGAAQAMLAVVHSAADLDAAAARHRDLPCPALWIVHPKGPAAPIGDGTIRQVLRAWGYVDTKTSAVSEVLTATRYTRR